MLHTATNLPPKKFLDRKIGIETVLQILALLVLLSIFIKAIIDIDIGYDPWWYHLPFAARIWGIVPKELFVGDEKWFEPRYQGFPLLAHFFQGFLWHITGRVQSTNLVGFLSLVFYLIFLRSFQIPLYLSAIALLAIPLVLAHSSSSLVDLLGNIGASILVMTTYNLYRRSQLPSKSELFILVIGAAIAANTKTQLQILVFFICGFVVIRLVWLYYRHSRSHRQLLKIVPVALLASLLIFATPVKNTALYGNPFYPVKVQVAGIVLNHKLVPEAYNEGSRTTNWLKSILEINAAERWSADQWSKDPARSRKGGFFGAYVVFNLLLPIGFCIREQLQNQKLPKAKRSRAATTALATILVMSIVPANFPQSHELRYFMFWMISLVSLNLYLISGAQTNENHRRWRWLQPKYMGLVYLVFLAIVLSKMSGYITPSFVSLEDHIATGVREKFMSQIQPDERVCLVSRHTSKPLADPYAALQYAFLYSSPFHPELDYSYAIKTVFDPQNCGGLKTIPYIDLDS